MVLGALNRMSMQHSVLGDATGELWGMQNPHTGLLGPSQKGPHGFLGQRVLFFPRDLNLGLD